MDFARVENELKKRIVHPYTWGRKQSDEWDLLTNFIYTTYSFEKLQEKVSSFDTHLKNYALNRWYNFWSAQAVENLFGLHQKVNPNRNKFDKLIDFSIEDISFDHKTTIFQKGFGQSADFAKNNPQKLVEWLYENQSQEGRKHLKNRLFIVLLDKNNQHWKLKSEINLLKTAIDNYVENFDSNKLIKLKIENNDIQSDIIWVEN